MPADSLVRVSMCHYEWQELMMFFVILFAVLLAASVQRNASSVSEKPLETMPVDFKDGGVICNMPPSILKPQMGISSMCVSSHRNDLSFIHLCSEVIAQMKEVSNEKEKTRASREKNELPSRSLLAKRSPSSRDRMDLKVAGLVDTTPYTASINGRQPNPHCNPTFYHNQYMPYPNLKTRTSERMFGLIRTGLWLL